MQRTMTEWVDRVYKAERALKRLETQNGGRWCEVTLKRTGEKVRIERTGYGPMECPENDSHDVLIGDQKVASFDNLHGVAFWLCNR